MDFKGCSEVWVILPNEAGVPLDSIEIKVYDSSKDSSGAVTVTITQGDFETVPGQYGDNPLYNFNVGDDFDGEEGDKILAVSVAGSHFVSLLLGCQFSLHEAQLSSLDTTVEAVEFGRRLAESTLSLS